MHVQQQRAQQYLRASIPIHYNSLWGIDSFTNLGLHDNKICTRNDSYLPTTGFMTSTLRMGKPKKPKDEILKRKRLAEQKRQERIRNDPVLYQQQKDNNRKRYLKRKQEKKLLPISEMTEKDRKKTRKRNRENFRAYYRRKKEKRLDIIEDEVIVDVDEPKDSARDPLNIVPFKNTMYLLRSKDAEECPIKSIISTDIIENTTALNLKSETNLTNNTSNSSDCLASLTLPISYTRSVGSDTILKPEESTCLDTEDTLNNDIRPNSSSCETPILYASISPGKKVKKRMDSSLAFKRYKHKVSKEMALMRKKIADLEREKEKYRKQALRKPLKVRGRSVAVYPLRCFPVIA
ncbi:hypothetical protein MSG28_006140 [Choristoneura fumiferana]|uniref:Uncharacterized protein n=1 Tax=Choristoneura fumiferana TaxID=7141 RepID=A0ACC0JDS3_CHOFU|nr:hypothetical protein MSG28_006140 [Choristoneura fumiferana]